MTKLRNGNTQALFLTGREDLILDLCPTLCLLFIFQSWRSVIRVMRDRSAYEHLVGRKQSYE